MKTSHQADYLSVVLKDITTTIYDYHIILQGRLYVFYMSDYKSMKTKFRVEYFCYPLLSFFKHLLAIFFCANQSTYSLNDSTMAYATINKYKLTSLYLLKLVIISFPLTWSKQLLSMLCL